eukprot:SAG31_NODE_1535_length_7971_cov_7.118438_2_plen_68_part_00
MKSGFGSARASTVCTVGTNAVRWAKALAAEEWLAAFEHWPQASDKFGLVLLCKAPTHRISKFIKNSS